MANQPVPVFKKLKREQEEPEESGVTLNDLPELPFEKILGYLSLQDRLRSRAVSRRWYRVINSFKVKSLCYSQCPRDMIFKKNRWVNGYFVQNFIRSSRFEAFFNTFGTTILVSLKQLRLCELSFTEANAPAFGSALSSFGQLKELGLFRFNLHTNSDLNIQVKLNLPMLESIQIEDLEGFRRLVLNAPRLQNVKILNHSFSLRVEIVPNADSVETLAISSKRHIALNTLKNLKYFYNGFFSELNFKTLFALKHLKEIHLASKYGLWKLSDFKKPEGLKIYLHGLLLDGPDDPAISSVPEMLEQVNFDYLAENYSRLVGHEIASIEYVYYEALDRLAPEMAINILKQFPDLSQLRVNRPVQDIERFLQILKNVDSIVDLRLIGDQLQELYDRLPEYWAIQSLLIKGTITDLGFLLKLKHLIGLYIDCLLDVKTNDGKVRIDVCVHSKRFEVMVDGKWTNVADLNAAIQFALEARSQAEMRGN